MSGHRGLVLAKGLGVALMLFGLVTIGLHIAGRDPGDQTGRLTGVLFVTQELSFHVLPLVAGLALFDRTAFSKFAGFVIHLLPVIRRKQQGSA